jgi:hypothetical protein
VYGAYEEKYGEFLNAEGAKVTRRSQKRNTKKYQKIPKNTKKEI